MFLEQIIHNQPRWDHLYDYTLKKKKNPRKLCNNSYSSTHIIHKSVHITWQFIVNGEHKHLALNCYILTIVCLELCIYKEPDNNPHIFRCSIKSRVKSSLKYC